MPLFPTTATVEWGEYLNEKVATFVVIITTINVVIIIIRQWDRDRLALIANDHRMITKEAKMEVHKLGNTKCEYKLYDNSYKLYTSIV